jgi:hypothetical protein
LTPSAARAAGAPCASIAAVTSPRIAENALFFAIAAGGSTCPVSHLYSSGFSYKSAAGMDGKKNASIPINSPRIALQNTIT